MHFKDMSAQGNAIGKDNFLKITPGQPTIVAFRGDPVDFYLHWAAGRGQVCTLKTEGYCAFCEKGERASFRFRINVIVNEGGQYVAKVWEQGRTIYDQLRSIHQDCDLEKHLMKITRSGTTKDNTTYTITPVMKDGEIKGEREAKISAVKLHDLSPGAAPKKEEPGPPVDNSFNELSPPPLMTNLDSVEEMTPFD